MTNQKPSSISPTVAWLLGLAGVLPFLFFSIFINSTHQSIDFDLGLMVYGAVILSFLSGAIWGLLISAENRIYKPFFLCLAVMPALFGWICVFVPKVIGLGILIVSFIFVLALDYFLFRNNKIESWYIKLRVTLTFLVILILAMAIVIPFWHVKLL